MKNKLQFTSDRYRKNRGGHSRWLRIFCEKCKTPVAIYQKDGPGILKRMYLDRIVAPAHLAGLQKTPPTDISNLTCPKCKVVLGIPIVYEKEPRLAFRLFAGAVGKKIISAEEFKKKI